MKLKAKVNAVVEQDNATCCQLESITIKQKHWTSSELLGMEFVATEKLKSNHLVISKASETLATLNASKIIINYINGVGK